MVAFDFETECALSPSKVDINPMHPYMVSFFGEINLFLLDYTSEDAPQIHKYYHQVVSEVFSLQVREDDPDGAK